MGTTPRNSASSAGSSPDGLEYDQRTLPLASVLAAHAANPALPAMIRPPSFDLATVNGFIGGSPSAVINAWRVMVSDGIVSACPDAKKSEPHKLKSSAKESVLHTFLRSRFCSIVLSDDMV